MFSTRAMLPLLLLLLAACGAAANTSTVAQQTSAPSTITAASIATPEPTLTSTTIPTSCASSTPTPAVSAGTIAVYFACKNADSQWEPLPVLRPAPQTDDTQALLRAALEALLTGPTEAEQAAGYMSPFGSATSGLLNDVSIDSAGVATIDFGDFEQAVPDLSWDASGMMNVQLYSTVFQFENIRRIIVELNGRCKIYSAVKPSGPYNCYPFSRYEWEHRTLQRKDGSFATPAAPATAPRETCAAPEPGPAPNTAAVTIYWYCVFDHPLDLPHPVTRRVPVTANTEALLRSALEVLLAGTTENDWRQGWSSPFGRETAGMLNNVSIKDGVATIDFDDFTQVVPNLTTSLGRRNTFLQLDNTVFQFSEIESIIYQFNGSCEAFAYRFEIVTCQPKTRVEWEAWMQQARADQAAGWPSPTVVPRPSIPLPRPQYR